MKLLILYMLGDEVWDGSHCEFFQFSKGVRVIYDKQTHNPEVVGSSPASATIKSPEIVRFQDFFLPFRGQKVQTKFPKAPPKPP